MSSLSLEYISLTDFLPFSSPFFTSVAPFVWDSLEPAPFIRWWEGLMQMESYRYRPVETVKSLIWSQSLEGSFWKSGRRLSEIQIKLHKKTCVRFHAIDHAYNVMLWRYVLSRYVPCRYVEIRHIGYRHIIRQKNRSVNINMIIFYLSFLVSRGRSERVCLFFYVQDCADEISKIIRVFMKYKKERRVYQGICWHDNFPVIRWISSPINCDAFFP